MSEQMPEPNYQEVLSKVFSRPREALEEMPMESIIVRAGAEAQRELLEGWRKMPGEEEARAKFIECVKKANAEEAYKGADSSDDARAKVIMAAFVLFHRWLMEGE